MKTFFFFLLLLFFSGCEFGYGISRFGDVKHLPNFAKLDQTLRDYPEVEKVVFSEKEISDGKVYNFRYSSKEGNVWATLSFAETSRGRCGREIRYSQYFGGINWDMRIPFYQETVDATWPVMKKIEKDLIEKFNMPEIKDSLKIEILRVQHPDRNLLSSNEDSK